RESAPVGPRARLSGRSGQSPLSRPRAARVDCGSDRRGTRAERSQRRVRLRPGGRVAPDGRRRPARLRARSPAASTAGGDGAGRSVACPARRCRAMARDLSFVAILLLMGAMGAGRGAVASLVGLVSLVAGYVAAVWAAAGLAGFAADSL